MEVPEQKHSFSCPGARDSGSLICVCRCGANPVANTGTPFSHEPEHPKNPDGVSEVARLVGGAPTTTGAQVTRERAGERHASLTVLGASSMGDRG